MLALQEYVDDQGRSPFARWFKKLDARAAAKIATTLARMEAGNLSEIKGIGEGVFERRLHYGPGYRIYFGRDGERLIVLLGGGTKQGQQKDIELAKRRWRTYTRY